MRKITLALLPFAVLALGACGSEQPAFGTGSSNDDGTGPGTGSGNGSGTGTGSGAGDPGSDPATDPVLSKRVVDYNEALRTASLKLTRRLPTLETIKKVADASEKKAAYEEELERMLDSSAFDARMVKFWRDTMRVGGGDLDSAPVFAAKLMAEGRDFTELFTASTGTCPSFDGTAETFAEGNCNNNVPAHAGVLTNPAVQSQFYGNMAFRRVRWVQEVFYCGAFPAEVQATPTLVDGKDYSAPWPFESISNAPIDFRDTSSVVCANCHATMNHVAPLFANFDADGMWSNSIQVETPLAPTPVTTELGHWLPAGQNTAWRFGVEVADLPALGQAIAADPMVAECLVARMWNFALSKEDIVNDRATVPYEVIDPFVYEFEKTYDLKDTLRKIMRSEDFVSF